MQQRNRTIICAVDALGLARRMRMAWAATVTLALTLVLALPAQAGSLERMALAPMKHKPAELVVVGVNGPVAYSPADLEAMDTYRMVTDTPWRETAAEFDGILLRDLLAMHGLEDVDSLRIVAENDYAVTMPRLVWESLPILIATRVDGKPHTRRERGPIQFVMPMDMFEANPEIREGHWVWMAARIEAGT